MSKRFKSYHNLNSLEYGIDLLNYLNIHSQDGKEFIDYTSAINIFVTGLINKIDQLEDRVKYLEKFSVKAVDRSDDI